MNRGTRGGMNDTKMTTMDWGRKEKKMESNRELLRGIQKNTEFHVMVLRVTWWGSSKGALKYEYFTPHGISRHFSFGYRKPLYSVTLSFLSHNEGAPLHSAQCYLKLNIERK